LVRSGCAASVQRGLSRQLPREHHVHMGPIKWDVYDTLGPIIARDHESVPYVLMAP
jgi:hypothetical protein